MDFKAIAAPVAGDFDAVNQFISRHLDSSVPLIREVGHYIVEGGGKRLRPLMCLLAARANGYEGDRHVNLAAVIELLHTATLLHDDVVDESSQRRGRPTVNAVWGNQAAVLVGDFLISRAFQLLVDIGHPAVLGTLSLSTNVISEGEVLQLLNTRDPDTSEERYMRVIHHKTAKMFESAAETGAFLTLAHDADLQPARDAFGTYGRHMGIAFQLVDDVLDYTGDPAALGKNVGDDLAEGKPTLPLIYTMREGTPAQADLIRTAIRTGGLDRLDEIIATVQSVGGLEYTREQARLHTGLALAALAPVPPSRYKQALEQLARDAAERRF